MEDETPSYRTEFLKSPHHGWMGLLTIGAGFMTGHPLPLIAGATAYVIGWLYLPDLPLFRGWVERRRAEERQKAEMLKVAEFARRRDSLLSSLAPQRLEKYHALARVCQSIETASADNPESADPRLRKLDELMWTYLRLLSIEESLERFVQTERGENLPALIQRAESEIEQLNAEIEGLKARSGGTVPDGKHRFLASRMERLDVLRKRQERCDQAQDNLALVVAEQERLDQQIKLIRADAVASRNAGALTARIDATVEHLDQTNRWIAQMDEFKDLVGDLPDTEMRVGFTPTAAVPPPIPQTAPPPQRARTRQ